MADKEATVYIVDVGTSMGRCHGGRSESDLEWSMRYVWDKLSTTVAASRKTWTVGVVGLRTDETNNPLQESEGYDNLSVLQPIAPMSLTALRNLRNRLRPSHTAGGDAVSAVILATDMIEKAAPKRLKFNRKIVLVTDGLGLIDGDDFDDLAAKLNELSIQFIVVGVDFDDAEYGFKEEDKSQLKAHNEKLLKALVDKCDNGVFGTMAEAIEELKRPAVKPYRPYKTYDGPLTLGDPTNYASALSINVERYFLTKLARPPAATTVVVKAGGQGGPGESTQSTYTLDGTDDMQMDNDAFSAVQSTRVYTVDDPTAPGGKREVPFDRLVKGYEYGRTAVYIDDSERNITQLNTTKSFSIVGFIRQENFERFLGMGESCIILPQRFNEKEELAFSAFVQAMDETKTFAVARFVAKDMKEPLLLLLMPMVSEDMICFYDIPLPFAEDIRTYPFPPLDKVVTASGSVLTKHRLLPDDQLNQAMSDYVDAMDLSTFGTDEDGQPAEYADLSENYSPIIYRVNKALMFRAINPDMPYVHADDDFVTRFDHPPEELVKRVQPQIAALINAASVKKVPPKARGRAARDNAANKPISGLDVDALLGIGKGGGNTGDKKPGAAKKISANNAIPEFKQALHATVSLEQVEDLTKQMGQIVQTLIASSTGNLNYARAIENIKVMRDELVGLEEPALFNRFMTDLKGQLAAEKLGGPRLDMWWLIRTSELGLIAQTESDVSEVTASEANEFYRHFSKA